MPDAEAGNAMAPSAATPGQRLWRKFLRARGAKPGLVMIAVFVFTAFFAPYLAHRLPLYWRDGATGEISLPLIREFFAPSDTTESFLERGINFVFLLLPLSLAAWFLIGRCLPALARAESRAVSLLLGALASGALWFGLGGMVWQAGGNDWLHYEIPPVPTEDDIVKPDAFFSSPSKLSGLHFRDYSDSNGSEKGAFVFGIDGKEGKLGKVVGDIDRKTAATQTDAAESAPAAKQWGIEKKAELAKTLEGIIEGEPLISVAEFSRAAPGVDTIGITDSNLSSGINTARWNRFVLEHAYPDALAPFRKLRSAFLTLAVSTVLVLAAMTYIFMAGANQFTLGLRWLVLLALAAALVPLFSGRPKNDPTPYRQLAAEGKGWGVFPPIPYGPNEQGFGPRLPPSWMTASPMLIESDIISWPRLAKALASGSSPATKRLLAAARETPALAAELDSPSATPPPGALAALNALLSRKDLFTREEMDGIKSDIYLQPYVTAFRTGALNRPGDVERLNRLLVERVLPGEIAPAQAGRWKKPSHIAGFHLLGTDESGRDVLVRLIHGARVSLSVGFVSVFLATVIGLVLGSLAAYYSGWVDIAISRFMEIMMCFPSFFLILAVIAVLDRRSILNIMLVIGLTSWTGVARLVRGEMLKQRKMDYVMASVALGAPDTRTIFRHILPNAMAPVLVSISFGITGAILAEAGLSFIGFGVTPPTPTWGQLLSETRDSPLTNWWLAVFPGLVLFLGVFSYNMVGEAARDALDPRNN